MEEFTIGGLRKIVIVTNGFEELKERASARSLSEN
jgi:hypothetical protein